MPECHYCDRAFPFSDASKAQHILNVQGKSHIRTCRNPQPVIIEAVKVARTKPAPKKKAKR